VQVDGKTVRLHPEFLFLPGQRDLRAAPPSGGKPPLAGLAIAEHIVLEEYPSGT
jgi:hypothetical protein